jgi:hypothetical protein
MRGPPALSTELEWVPKAYDQCTDDEIQTIVTRSVARTHICMSEMRLFTDEMSGALWTASRAEEVLKKVRSADAGRARNSKVALNYLSFNNPQQQSVIDTLANQEREAKVIADNIVKQIKNANRQASGGACSNINAFDNSSHNTDYLYTAPPPPSLFRNRHPTTSLHSQIPLNDFQTPANNSANNALRNYSRGNGDYSYGGGAGVRNNATQGRGGRGRGGGHGPMSIAQYNAMPGLAHQSSNTNRPRLSTIYSWNSDYSTTSRREEFRSSQPR